MPEGDGVLGGCLWGGHMPKFVALHDRRMNGGVPARPDLAIINTDENTPLGHAFARINRLAHGGRIHTMFVLCHGKSKWVQNDRDMISERSGSGGLTLGKEMVLQENVQLWRSIHGQVATIVV